METTMDFSRATPDLLNAFVKAQERGGTVGKDSEAQSRRYVTGERMIKEAQACLDGLGIALVTSGWAVEAPTVAPGDIGGQFAASKVRMSWALIGHGGVITGTCEMHCVASKSRPHEKAEASTLTYMTGYLVRGMFLLARGEHDEYDVSRRDDRTDEERARDDAQARAAERAAAERAGAPKVAAKSNAKPAAKAKAAPPAEPPASKPAAAPASKLPATDRETNAARKLAGERGKAYTKRCKLKGVRVIPWETVVLEATGRRWNTEDPPDADGWDAIADAYGEMLAALDDDDGGDGPGFDPYAPEAAT